jgi:hypothetical protein
MIVEVGDYQFPDKLGFKGWASMCIEESVTLRGSRDSKIKETPCGVKHEIRDRRITDDLQDDLPHRALASGCYRSSVGHSGHLSCAFRCRR